MDPRDQTFMTIHNLTPDANILFASDSILDILGYQPDEVRGKSAFDYFHPEEMPFARSIHSRGVLLDKAAVLHYARIRSKAGQWVSCECCFTIVHNVLVASASIYFKGEKSERRARDAPQIRRIFSSSPRDPRYHMLEHLSPKFKMPPMEREPRAALILNRFTRNLTIMYATDAVAQVLGVRSDEVLERPFYECIQPNCLDEAERCLESAKANESIAYLRFWYKDPRVDANDAVDEDDEVEMEDDVDDRTSPSPSEDDVKDLDQKDNCMDVDDESDPQARGADDGGGSEDASPMSQSRRRRQQAAPPRTFELEAVVSCTSDGLVVVLRRARPPIPDPQPPVYPSALNYENGLFAAPWGMQPIEPYISPELLYTFRPPFLPQYMPLRDCVKAAGGPPIDQLMRSIRDVAVFAWAVTGINPNLANYGQGRRRIGAQATEGHPAWDANNGCPTTYPPPEDLPTDRTGDIPKAASASANMAPFGHYPSDAPAHGYRARHASLDESMYELSGGGSSGGSSSRPSAWGSTASTQASTSTASSAYSSYDRRPPLRPAFSYNALHDHARYQQQQQQQGYAPQAPAGLDAGSRRCNFRDEPWGAGVESGRACLSGYGGGPSVRGVGMNGGGGDGMGGRYFWQ
ncbi:hypothetical protein C8A05DRAFT_47360 [Staphylotrichum tortipilum]|uniref:PAS domain-containing protein n=1 Tax=Staphylotrichum tortipilum TaxID=2831512 RepID=A0AAN6RQ18_9PEZI|nr:hypothetical protein C8A05DRAFT_47360 [Staphylotrichum longicolle]